MHRIYLAGPITGCTYDGCTSWRDQFAEHLALECQRNAETHFDFSDLRCLSPMRGKDYLLTQTSIGDSYPDTLLSSQRAIMTRDYFDCMRADALVVNLLGADRVSIGTVMEVAWAYSKRTPVIAVMEEQGNCHEHSMLREAFGYRCTTLEQAAYLSLMLLWPKLRG